MDIAREDLLLVALAAAFILPFGYSWYTSTASGQDVDHQFCEDTANAVEQNTTATACNCLPPGTFDPEPYSAGEYVDNRTELFLVQCDMPNGQKLTQPVRRVRDDAYNETEKERIYDRLNRTQSGSGN